LSEAAPEKPAVAQEPESSVTPSKEEAAPEPSEMPRPAAAKVKAEADESLLALEAAVDRVPESLRQEMADLLRAEFREVVRWRPRL
jgi:hypothetical protein